MSEHPYPKHVVEAVKNAIDYALFEDSLDDNHLADSALEALWDENQIDTLDQLDRLHDHALIVDVDGYWFQKNEYEEPEDHDNSSWPMHAVYYWGDPDGPQ